MKPTRRPQLTTRSRSWRVRLIMERRSPRAFMIVNRQLINFERKLLAGCYA